MVEFSVFGQRFREISPEKILPFYIILILNTVFSIKRAKTCNNCTCPLFFLSFKLSLGYLDLSYLPVLIEKPTGNSYLP